MDKGRYRALMDLCGIETDKYFDIFEGNKRIISNCQFKIRGDTYHFYMTNADDAVLHVLVDEILIGLAIGRYNAKESMT